MFSLILKKIKLLAFTHTLFYSLAPLLLCLVQRESRSTQTAGQRLGPTVVSVALFALLGLRLFRFFSDWTEAAPLRNWNWISCISQSEEKGRNVAVAGKKSNQDGKRYANKKKDERENGSVVVAGPKYK